MAFGSSKSHCFYSNGEPAQSGARKTRSNDDFYKQSVKSNQSNISLRIGYQFPYKYVGKVSGILYTIFGGIGIGVVTITLIVLSALNILIVK